MKYFSILNRKLTINCVLIYKDQDSSKILRSKKQCKNTHKDTLDSGLDIPNNFENLLSLAKEPFFLSLI